MSREIFWGIAAAILSGSASFLLTFFFVKKSMAERIRKLVRSAERSAEGEFEKALADDPGFEVLAHAANRVAGVLKSRVAAVENEKKKLSAILENMAEGVLAVDRRRQVLIMNPGAAAILEVSRESALGESLIAVARNREIDEMMERALMEQSRFVREVELSHPHRKMVRAHAVGISSGGEVSGILVLNDISEMRRLENLRREFVANVSHELRTPLTSLRGFVETLLAGAVRDPVRSASFLKMMEEDAVRLNRLIDDLLELSKIESKEIPLAIEPVDLGSEIEKALPVFQSRIEEKKLKVEKIFTIPPAEPIAADRDRLKQVLVNLLDNAIKFGKPGGRIILRAEQVADKIKVSVEDDGIGIPREAVPRVFERFFCVDKARSRALGGTGLGLAIVKHIIEAHGGMVSCESEIGRGSKFSFTLPVGRR